MPGSSMAMDALEPVSSARSRASLVVRDQDLDGRALDVLSRRATVILDDLVPAGGVVDGVEAGLEVAA
jgi:hypothetical protein